MNFTTGYILTKAGEALHAQVEAGTTLKLTKMQLGSGTVTTVDDYYERSTLVEPQNAMSIAEIQQVTAEKNMCVATAVLTNAAVDTSYMASELGLFAQNTDGTEILYAVSYDDHPSYIASKNDGTDITMKFSMYIVATSEITITLTLPKTAEEIATVAAGYAAKAAESEAKAKQLEATANDYLQTTQQAMTLANRYANISKAWAEGDASPDGVADTDSPTGYTQSAKIWAALSREYAGMSKFKLPIAYYNSVDEMKASETTIVGRPCVTLGFMTKGDGRGAKYAVREPKDTDVYDDYSVVKLDNGKVAELIESSQAYEDDVKIIFPLYGDAEHPPVEETNGDCILVGRKNHWFMIDTYLCENNYVMIQRTMKAHNIKTLDFVLITHYHGDHYGNLERLLKDTAVSVKKVLLPRTTSQPDLASSVTSAQTTCIKWCTDNNVAYEIADNQVFDFYGATVKIFNASAEDYAYYENLNDKEYNDYSVCMLLSFMGRTALFTGDTQKAAKEKIVTDCIVTKPVDLFKMAHHANGPHVSQFARRLSPKYVVATQTQRMSSISASWSSLSYYQSLGAYAHVVGWQSEDLVYSMSMLGVSMVSNGICAMDTRGWEAIDIFVDASVPRGTFCDGSKEHPYNDLQDAFDNCMHNGLKGAVIHIASGDYTKNEIAHSGIVRLQYANGIYLVLAYK